MELGFLRHKKSEAPVVVHRKMKKWKKMEEEEEEEDMYDAYEHADELE